MIVVEAGHEIFAASLVTVIFQVKSAVMRIL
jgi:hypothetical protein